MADVLINPEVPDYIRYMTLDEIAARPKGIMDLFEDGIMVILKDYRLDFDFAGLDGLDHNLDGIEEKRIWRKLKKLEATNFFEGDDPTTSRSWGKSKSLTFKDPVRQALFDRICHGDPEIFERASAALKYPHEELHRIFKICFPTYETTRLVPSLRLTETKFENLHWDNHSIDDDFHQARIFCNLDRNKRLWNVGARSFEYLEAHYDELDLAQFAGKDPNIMLNYVTNDVMGGSKKIWKDNRPRHSIAFEPGEVWIGESRLISHQIWYGQRAMVYMWFVDKDTMDDPDKRFNARIEAMHEKMAARAA